MYTTQLLNPASCRADLNSLNSKSVHSIKAFDKASHGQQNRPLATYLKLTYIPSKAATLKPSAATLNMNVPTLAPTSTNSGSVAFCFEGPRKFLWSFCCLLNCLMAQRTCSTSSPSQLCVSPAKKLETMSLPP